MKTFLKVLASLLLLFNGIGAIYGGLSLIIYPDGSNISLPTGLLKHTPFLDYFIPGLILFTVNGLFSLFTLVAMALKLKAYPLLIITQGIILFGWIIMQIILIQTIFYLHVVLGLVGISLVIVGFTLKNSRVGAGGDKEVIS